MTQDQRYDLEKKQLRKAAKEFESLFVKQLLKGTKSTIARSMFGGGMAEEFFTDTLNDERAKSIVQAGGFGIAELIENEISKNEEKRVKFNESRADKLNMKSNKIQALKAYESRSE